MEDKFGGDVAQKPIPERGGEELNDRLRRFKDPQKEMALEQSLNR